MLDQRDRDILDFEGWAFRHMASKEQAARDLFGTTAVVYFQRLNALIDRPEALAYAPVTVKRLRRLRDARRSGATTR